MKRQKINLDETNVLITHQFIAGNKEVIKSESEAVLSVGGSEIIDVSLVKQFVMLLWVIFMHHNKFSCDAIRS